MDKIRVGVVGMGMMGDAHARIYKANDQVKLVGCCEPNEARKREAEETLGVPVYAVFGELLDQGLDALSVCTPDHMHERFVVEALERKIKVIVEKPLEISTGACRRILAARPDPSYLTVGHDLRFDIRAIHAKRACEAGQLGKLLSISVKRSNNMTNCGRIGPITSVAWFLGIHDIDLVCWVSGLAVREVISAAGFKCHNDHWDYVTACLRMEGDTMLLMENHWINPNDSVKGNDGWIKMIGTKGSIDLDMMPQTAAYTYSGEKAGYFDVHHQADDLFGVPSGDLRYQLEHFVHCVRYGEIPLTTGEEAAEDVRVIEEIERKLESTGYNINLGN